MSLNFNIKLQPKQIDLYKLIDDQSEQAKPWIGYGGSRGGAKSHAIRDIALIECLKHKGLKVAIFRRLRDDLEENHIIPLLQKYPGLRQYMNMTKFILTLPNGSIIFFNYCQNEDDVYGYTGKEYDLVFIDEATHFSQIMIEFLKTCNRTPRTDFKAKIILTTNPGNVGHAFIKRIFIDKIYTDNENENDYVYMPARVHDNVVWVMKALERDGITAKQYYTEWTDEQRFEYTLKHSDYANALSHLPEELKQANLYGNWEIFGGQFFKYFNKNEQIIKPFNIPAQWQLCLSIDPGYSSPCSAGLTARDYEGGYYRIATYYEKERSPSEHLQAVKEWLNSVPFIQKKKPDIIVAGRDAWASKDKYAIMANDLTWADVWEQGGLYLEPAITDRKQGWWTWKGLIPDKYFIFENWNEPLIEEMTSVVSDKKHVEDIQGGGNDPNIADHALDEQRYGIMAIYKPADFVRQETTKSERYSAVYEVPGESLTIADF